MKCSGGDGYSVVEKMQRDDIENSKISHFDCSVSSVLLITADKMVVMVMVMGVTPTCQRLW